MKIRLKPIDEQVLVITGADSGIGLATARAAAGRGANVVLCSRSAEELRRLCAELEAEGPGHAAYFACDVADELAMRRLAQFAVETFGRIDTWVNNAGASIYGPVEQTPVDDARRLFETNYWGVVNGSLAAIPYLSQEGGALINVGSVVSDRAVPLQGHYSASKHAVKGFTDALRMELRKDNVPVAVTLVKPGSIDTPFTRHAENLMEAPPQLPPPVYAPEVVADAILECAQHPTASVTVGGGGRALAMMGTLAPRAADRQMRATLFRQQKRKEPTEIPQENTLWAPPRRTGRVHGDHPGHVAESSAYTRSSFHAGKIGLALAGLGAAYLLARTAGLASRSEFGTVEVDLDARRRAGLDADTDEVFTRDTYGTGAMTVPPGTVTVADRVERVGGTYDAGTAGGGTYGGAGYTG